MYIIGEVHAYIHTNLRALHTHMNAGIHTYTHERAIVYIQTYIHIFIHTFIHRYKQKVQTKPSYIHSYLHVHITGLFPI